MRDNGVSSEELIRLSFFTEMGKDIVSEATMRGVLDKVMLHVGSFFAPLNWSILLLDSDKDELVFKIAIGKASETLQGRRIPAGEGVAGWVVRNALPTIVEDASLDPRFSRRMDALTGFVTESIIAVPLRTDDRLFGLIELINKLDGSHFTPFDLHVLSTIADFAAIAIEKVYYLRAARRTALYDHLTAVLNRRGLEKVLEREKARARREGGATALILADVDDFKRINDAYGHAAGDRVLISLAKAMRDSVRELDSVARYGGDEFMVVMPKAGIKEGELVTERIRQAIAAIPAAGGPSFTCSFGVRSSESEDFDALIRRSDEDLYRDKERKAAMAMDRDILTELEHEENGLE